MSEVEIRWANYNDWHDVSTVHSDSYRSAYKGIMPDDYLTNLTVEKWEKYYQESLSGGIEKSALIFVDCKAIGCIIIGKCQDVDLDDTYEIQSIYLLQSYWGKGFGKRLINWAINEIRELGCVNISLWVLKENTNARKIYEHLGFMFDGTERLITRGKELTQVRYRKTNV